MSTRETSPGYMAFDMKQVPVEHYEWDAWCSSLECVGRKNFNRLKSVRILGLHRSTHDCPHCKSGLFWKKKKIGK